MFLLFLKLYPLGMSILEQCPNNKTVQTIEYVHICRLVILLRQIEIVLKDSKGFVCATQSV